MLLFPNHQDHSSLCLHRFLVCSRRWWIFRESVMWTLQRAPLWWMWFDASQQKTHIELHNLVVETVLFSWHPDVKEASPPGGTVASLWFQGDISSAHVYVAFTLLDLSGKPGDSSQDRISVMDPTDLSFSLQVTTCWGRAPTSPGQIPQHLPPPVFPPALFHLAPAPLGASWPVRTPHILRLLLWPPLPCLFSSFQEERLFLVVSPRVPRAGRCWHGRPILLCDPQLGILQPGVNLGLSRPLHTEDVLVGKGTNAPLVAQLQNQGRNQSRGRAVCSRAGTTHWNSGDLDSLSALHTGTI